MSTAKFGIALCVFWVVLGLLLITALDMTDPVRAAARAAEAGRQEVIAQRVLPLRIAVAIAWEVFKLSMLAAGTLLLIWLAVAIGRAADAWLSRRAIRVYAKGGVFPATQDQHGTLHPGPNEPGWQLAAVIAERQRVSAAVAGRLAAGAPTERLPQITVSTPEPDLPADVPIHTAALPPTLALPIGRAADGDVFQPLRNLGCVAVGGLQGSGKSEWVAAALCGLHRQDPTGASWQFGMIDMKGSDFVGIPDDLRTLRWPKVTNDLPGAVRLLRNVWRECQDRLRLLAEADAPNIETYNERNPQRLPYLLLFCEEMLFLTGIQSDTSMPKPMREMSAEFISTASQMAAVCRAAGMSLVMTTQRCSADVVPSTLTSLCGTRMSYRVLSVESSRVVLGVPGAEQLPDLPGRALFYRGSGVKTVQTYRAGIEEGRFSDFLRTLPRLERLTDTPISRYDSTVQPPSNPAVPAAELPDTAVSFVSPTPEASFPVSTDPLHTHRIWRYWLSTTTRQGKHSLRQTQLAKFGYFGGRAFEVCSAAVNLWETRHGRPAPYTNPDAAPDLE